MNKPKQQNALEIEEVREPESMNAEELAEVNGGATFTTARQLLINRVKTYDFGNLAIDVTRIRPGVAMLQSGHSPSPDFARAGISVASQFSKL